MSDVECQMEMALTHVPIVGIGGISRAVDHARRRGHGQEVAAVAVARRKAASAAGGGVGRHIEVLCSEGKAAAHARTHYTTLMHDCVLSLQPRGRAAVYRVVGSIV